MVDRLTFFNSVSGITDPGLVIRFYDNFIALKQLLNNSTGFPSVDSYNNSSIKFSVSFQTARDKKETLNMIQSGTIIIYGKPISVLVEDASVRGIYITTK